MCGHEMEIQKNASQMELWHWVTKSINLVSKMSQPTYSAQLPQQTTQILYDDYQIKRNQ